MTLKRRIGQSMPNREASILWHHASNNGKYDFCWRHSAEAGWQGRRAIGVSGGSAIRIMPSLRRCRGVLTRADEQLAREED